ncbi:MAG TPA: type II secretion system F family protein [Brevibacterium ravenspurgense]|nr:type II secretion system F family protein [Brevibacterium ravenspurgense]
MNTLGIIVLAVAVLGLAVIGATSFAIGTLEQRDIVKSETSLIKNRDLRGRIFSRLDRWLMHVPYVDRLGPLLVQANIRRIRPSEFALLLTVTVLAAFFFLSTVMAAHWAFIIAAVITAGTIYGVIQLRRRQYEKLMGQLPELARILSNSTGAGLSVATALHIAGQELPDPAGREIQVLSREIDLGMPIDEAFERLNERVPGRDLGVLVSILVISHRSGGSLISALRGLSTTLETRKETKREVKTLVSESSFTGYMVAGMGIGLVALTSMFSSDVLHKLTTSIVGQIAIVVAMTGYIIGIVAINRMTRVKL